MSITNPVVIGGIVALLVAIAVAVYFLVIKKKSTTSASTGTKSTTPNTSGVVITSVSWGGQAVDPSKFGIMFAPTTGAILKDPNGSFGDPKPGVVKTLDVAFTNNGVAGTYKWTEADRTVIKLPV